MVDPQNSWRLSFHGIECSEVDYKAVGWQTSISEVVPEWRSPSAVCPANWSKSPASRLVPRS